MKKSIFDSIINDIENAKLFTIASDSFKAVKKQWPLVFLSVFIDFLFLFVSGVSVTLIQFPVLRHLEALMVLAGESTGGLLNVMNQTMDIAAEAAELGTSAAFQMHLNAIFKWLFLMVFVAFTLWIIFQGLNWYIAHRIASKNTMHPLKYMKNFALQSVPFYFTTIFLIYFSIRMLFEIKISISNAIDENMVNFAFIMAVLIVWYFGTLCFSMTGNYAWKNLKQCFGYGARKFLKTIQTYGFLLVIFIFIHLVLSIKYLDGHPNIMILLGLILFLPAVCYARVMLFRTTEEYWTKQQHKEYPKKHHAKHK